MNATAGTPVSETLQRRSASAAIFVSTLVSLALAFALGIRFASLGGATSGIKHVAFLYMATIGQVSAFFLLPALLFLALSKLPVGRTVLRGALPFVFALLSWLLVIDQGLYGFFGFHFNGLVVRVLLSPVVRARLDIPRSDVVFIAILGVVLLAGHAFLFHGLRRRFAAPPAWRPRWALLVSAVLALLFAEKVIYAFADLRGERHIVRSAKAVPFYQPVTIWKLAHKMGWVPKTMRNGRRDPATYKTKVVDPSAARLKYPLKPLTFAAPATLPNIVWVNLEGWRWDMFDPETTPNSWEWSKGEQVFDYHISGGNRTATATFSMFYGLEGSYWDTFLSERRGPVLISRLRELGYRLDANAGREVGMFDMKNATFVEQPDAYEFDWPTEDSAVKDRAVLADFEKFVDESGDKPFFSWTLFDSSHVKYYFPPEFAKFKPYAEKVSYREFSLTDQRILEAKNRYRNALNFEDSLVGAMIEHLRKRDLLDKTIVIVSGDHGEEFNENGHWTHGGACTPQVVRVPMIVHIPGMTTPAHHDYVTSHHDIVPTLMEKLGTTSPPDDYTLGRALFGAERVPHVVVCGYDQNAIVDESGWFIFGRDFQNPWDAEVRDPDYVEIDDTTGETERRTLKAAELIRKMNSFLK